MQQIHQFVILGQQPGASSSRCAFCFLQVDSYFNSAVGAGGSGMNWSRAGCRGL
jgi:hypothetical protein